MSDWTCALELDSQRRIVSGSEGALAQAISRGADLRVGTEFQHNEHIDVDSDSPERVRDVAEFGVTYLVDGRGVATLGSSGDQMINRGGGSRKRPHSSESWAACLRQRCSERPNRSTRRSRSTLGASSDTPHCLSISCLEAGTIGSASLILSLCKTKEARQSFPKHPLSL